MNRKYIVDETFDNLVCTDKKLDGQEYENCIFLNGEFTKANFSMIHFMDCTFRNCNLTMALMENAGLKNVQFIGCKLTGIDFGKCHDFLFGVGFEDCLLDYSSFYQKKMKKTIFKNCSLKEVDFTEVDLSQSSFADCDLLNTNFHQTNLEKANFKTAVNYTIDPELNKMKKAAFHISGVAGLLNKYSIDITYH